MAKVQRARRGGVGAGEREDGDALPRITKWRQEAARMKLMIRTKKEECWRRFCEEHGEANPWEIVRWAKDPWKLKESMGDLKDLEGKELSSDEEKAEGITRDLFGWDEEGRKVEEEDSGEDAGVEIDVSREELERLVRRALGGTLNKSAAGPNGIGY